MYPTRRAALAIRALRSRRTEIVAAACVCAGGHALLQDRPGKSVAPVLRTRCLPLWHSSSRPQASTSLRRSKSRSSSRSFSPYVGDRRCGIRTSQTENPKHAMQRTRIRDACTGPQVRLKVAYGVDDLLAVIGRWTMRNRAKTGSRTARPSRARPPRRQEFRQIRHPHRAGPQGGCENVPISRPALGPRSPRKVACAGTL